MSRVLLLLVAAAGVAAGQPPAAGVPAAPAPRPIPVDELVRQLVAPDPAARAAAEARLSGLTLAPPAALLALAAGPDGDARARAARAARAMRGNAAAPALVRGERFAAGGRVDLFVAATGGWDADPDDPRLWDPALRVGRALMARTGRKSHIGVRSDPSGCPDFAEYIRRRNPRITRSDRPHACLDPTKLNPPRFFLIEAVQAPGVVSPWGLNGTLVVSRGGVRADRGVSESLVLATGDLTIKNELIGSEVVCDGDVTIGDHVEWSTVVARGDIRVGTQVCSAELVAGGVVVVGQPRENDARRVNVIREREPRALGWVRFFELADVGVSARAAGGDVAVAAVAAGSAGARAGLRAGDVVLEAGGRRPADADGLRRALRDALAAGDAAVRVKRGAEALTVRVALPDEPPADPPPAGGK
jgi:hypothetical protein